MKTATMLIGILLAAATAGAQTVAITGATIHTMGPQGTIENGTIVIDGGKIAAVGRDVAVPSGARRIDGRGGIVTPGLFNSLTRLGIVEVSSVEGTTDQSVEGDEITAAFDVTYGINPDSVLIPVTRIDGITRAIVAPTAGGRIIGGQGAVIHLGTDGPLVVASPAAMFAWLGEDAAESSGGARGAAMLRLREALQDALDFAANRRAFDAGERREYALSRLDLEALGSVVRGELPLVVSVRRASDILGALALAREFDLDLILANADEAWEVAGDIRAADVPVIVNPMDNLPSSFEALGATLENAARLHRAGVTVAFMTGDAHNARNIRQGAGNAVAYGMPWEAALAAITSVPARVWGIASSYGTLEPGKDADVVLWDGDPLELRTFPAAVFIRGRQIPLESRELELQQRYRDLSRPLPPAYSGGPGR